MVDPKYAKVGRVENRVAEECAELILTIQKAERFGIDNRNPNTGFTNRDEILMEITDVRRVMLEYETQLLRGESRRENPQVQD